MSDIVAFLRDRLDEDERVATDALEHLESKGSWWAWASLTKRFSELARADARHMERHSPARVLREVRAKRALLKDASDVPTTSMRRALRHAVAAYADHPDYDPAWSVK